MVMSCPPVSLFVCRRSPSCAFGSGYLVERPACARRYLKRICKTERQALATGPSDHRAIVRAQVGRRHNQSCADFEGEAIERLTDRLVRGHAAGGNESARGPAARAEIPKGGPERARCPEARAENHQAGTQPLEHNVDDRLLEAGAEIGDILITERRDLFRLQPQRGLETGEREIGVFAPMHRARKRETRAVAAKSFLLDLRSAGIPKAQ